MAGAFRTILISAGGVAAALALASAGAAQSVDRGRWGFYGDLPGGNWTGRLSSGDVELTHYTWLRPGEVLRGEHHLAGTQFVAVETITPGREPGQLVITTQENDRDAPTRSLVTLNPDGSAVEAFVGRTGRQERATYTPLDADHYQVRNEVLLDGGWREIWSIEVSREKG